MTTPTAVSKVTAGHLARTAYLYVRQSSLRQVMHNTESGERQYALRQRAVALGWPSEQIVVIDSDQGQSGASAAGREGFQRLVADVGLGKAGIVLGLEVSRLARNNADWHRLLEISALSGTLICDEDGLYDPADFNDRLLLGLKGTMSEAELHFIRGRLQGGILSKARRGELQTALPIGLVYDPAGRVVLDPDSGVQGALGQLFASFGQTGSARAVVAAFAEQGLRFPTRPRSGPHKGELGWTELTHSCVLRTLHNPRYAGAFVYGRKQTKTSTHGATSATTRPREQWTLLRDAHPGYISFEQFELNERLLAANAQAHGRERTAGPAREGPALLQGLAVCGRCGKRMTVRYHHRRRQLVPDYQCMADCIESAARRCLAVPGHAVDAAISGLLLDTVTPLALDVALTVQAELQARADHADQLRRSHVDRARQRAELARRRYLAVDPANRLVADTLEADYNQALRDVQAAQDDYDRATAAAHAAFTEQHKRRVRALAADFPALWNDPATPTRERKRITRLLIEDITLDRTDDRIHAHVRFRGGQITSLTLPIPPKAWQTRQTHPDTLALLDRLLDDHTDAAAAEALNTAAHRTGTGAPFTGRIVYDVRHANGILGHADRLRARGLLTLDEIAERLRVHPATIKRWHAAGLLASQKANDKNERLFEPPTPGDPRLVKQHGWTLTDRECTQLRPGGAL